jgi:hypothetical protein
MKDPSDQIISAFYAALNGQLSYGSVNWPVYTSSPSGTDYVLIGDLDLVDASAKIERLHEGTITVEIVNGGNNKTFSRKKVNDIADDILGKIAYVYLSMTGFAMVVAPYVESMNTYEETNDTEIVVRKLITFRFIVQQTT